MKTAFAFEHLDVGRVVFGTAADNLPMKAVGEAFGVNSMLEGRDAGLGVCAHERRVGNMGRERPRCRGAGSVVLRMVFYVRRSA
jgi:RimJ/RimL family protein N-acetyltransferase